MSEAITEDLRAQIQCCEGERRRHQPDSPRWTRHPSNYNHRICFLTHGSALGNSWSFMFFTHSTKCFLAEVCVMTKGQVGGRKPLIQLHLRIQFHAFISDSATFEAICFLKQSDATSITVIAYKIFYSRIS
mgnify:CR=1 FL=1